MRLSAFILEDEFNRNESRSEICLSSACAPANSIEDLLSLYSDDESQEIGKGLMQLKLDYSEQLGSKVLRQQIAAMHSKNLQPEDILLTSGASEAIFLTLTTLFEAGDTIIVQRPIYQSLYQVAVDTGVNVLFWDYDLEGSFAENLVKLKEIIDLYIDNKDQKRRLKALVLNNPNNPSARTFDETELQEIIDLIKAPDPVFVGMQRRDPYLIVDQVFNEIRWQAKETQSILDLYPNSIVISDLSKAFAFPGLRLGWIASKARRHGTFIGNTKHLSIVEVLSAQKNYLSLRSNTLSEYLGKFIIEKRSELCSQVTALAKENYDYLQNLDVESLPFELPQSEPEKLAGLCLFPKIKNDAKAIFSEESLEKLIAEHGLFIVNGAVFGFNYSEHFRLGLGLEHAQFKKALDILITVYQSLKGSKQAV